MDGAMEHMPGKSAPDRDPRIYFAAERTFLAWIRTGLALMGFGFVVARFGLFLRELGAAAIDTPVRTSGFSLWTGTALVMVGVVINVVSAFQHARTIRHLNLGQDVTGRMSATGLVLATLLALVGLAMSGYLLIVR
jgi:putative membrane protein